MTDTIDAIGVGSRALRRCIAIDPAQFATEVWGRGPLLTRAADLAPSGPELLSVAAVDELISRRGLRTPFARMAKQGRVLPAARFTRSGGTGAGISDQVADDKVLDLMADGATLVLQGLHRLWPPLVDFGSELAGDLGHPVQINAYVTPAQNQGFAPHFDTHDVFVLQVSGRKRWIIHPPVLTAPMPEQNWEKYADAVAARASETPLLDVTLEPGDVLYLPRGFIHAATALGELSIHLTVGIHPITRYTLMRELLAAAAADEAARESLPMGLNLADPQVLGPLIDDAAAQLAHWSAGHRDDASVATTVTGRIGAELRGATRPAPIRPLAQAETLSSLTIDTRLRRRAGLRVDLIDRTDQSELRFMDRRLAVPTDRRAAVEFALVAGSFTPADLPGLSAVDQLDLAHELLTAAVVVPAETDG